MFPKVTLAAAVVFSYAWIAPAIVYAAMRFSSLGLGTVGLWDVVCLYGYSMCVFVPASLVLIVQGFLFLFNLLWGYPDCSTFKYIEKQLYLQCNLSILYM